MKRLLLFSAGLDSTSLLYILKRRGEEVDLLFADYGQRSARQQYTSALAIARKEGVEIIRLPFPRVGRAFQRGERIKHEPISHRNAVLVPMGLVYARENGYTSLYSGIVNEDCTYEPNRPMIWESLRALGRSLGVTLETPLAGIPKYMVLRNGIKAGMDPSMTYSCLLGRKKHCGRCPQCEARKKAFMEAGLDDPTEYEY